MWKEGRGLAWLLLLGAGCGNDDEGGGGRAPPPSPAPPPAQAGPDPFDEAVLATYEIAVDPQDWDAIVDDPYDNTWRRCSVTWQGESFPDVGLRPSGERSRIPGNPKPSLRLEFDEFLPDREFHGLSTLKLDAVIHDRSMMRARLEYPLYAAAGVPAPRYVHARVVVNGDYKGLYGIEERLGREFLRKRFGPPVSQLYEFLREGQGGDVRWSGPDVWRYVPSMWLPKIEELPDEAEAVMNLVDILNNRPADAPGVFDVDRFLGFIAAEVVPGEGDGYLAGEGTDGAENMYLGKDPANGLYVLLPWDRDQGFVREETEVTFRFDRRILTRNLILQNPTNLQRYRTIVRGLVEGPFETTLVQARVDFILDQIRAAALEDPLKPYSNEEFLQQAERIKAYVAARNQALLAQVSP
jgi:hypothetical protein